MRLMSDSDSNADRGEHVDFDTRSRRTEELVTELHAIVSELEELHPGRRFTPDGHLVGSLGEAAAEALFDIQLAAPSTKGYDAVASDGRPVEIKATYGTPGVAIRFTSHGAASALIVLRLSRDPSQDHEVVYNGPLEPVAELFGAKQSNGQARASLARLRVANTKVRDADRVPLRSPREP
jgi:hypothetical protein